MAWLTIRSVQLRGRNRIIRQFPRCHGSICEFRPGDGGVLNHRGFDTIRRNPNLDDVGRNVLNENPIGKINIVGICFNNRPVISYDNSHGYWAPFIHSTTVQNTYNLFDLLTVPNRNRTIDDEIRDMRSVHRDSYIGRRLREWHIIGSAIGSEWWTARRWQCITPLTRG